MPLVYSFYPEESVVSLSSKFQFSGLRMSSVDPLSGQVPSGVWLDWPCSYLFVQRQKFYPKKWEYSLEVRVLNPISDFLN